MQAATILAIVPVVLAVALVILIIRRNITQRSSGDPIDITGAIPAIVILLVAALLIGSFTYSATDHEDFDSDTGVLTIKTDIAESSRYPWTSYQLDVTGLVIEDGVESIPDNALTGMTSLEFVSIPDSMGSAPSLGVTLLDPYGQSTSATGTYLGPGDGSAYLLDPTIFTFSNGGATVSGLAASASGAVGAVIPTTNNGVAVTEIANNAFKDNATLVFVGALPDSRMTSIGSNAFNNCSSLEAVTLSTTLLTIGGSAFQSTSALTDMEIPASLTSIGGSSFRASGIVDMSLPAGVTSIPSYTFYGCSSLESIGLPNALESIGDYAFNNCSAMTSMDLPASLKTIGERAFQGCSAMTAFSLPARMTAIGAQAFIGCTGATAVEFATGWAPELGSNWAQSWTFYETDGTTTIDKTVASNLAGKTFMGTAAALVEVSPGLLTLTPQQIQIVHLHDQELQTMLDSPSLDPLPFQPSLQTQDQELVSA